MILDRDLAAKVAEKLLEIEAVKLNTAEPFTWTSGIKSPIYCDNRKALGFPEVRSFIKKSFAEEIKKTNSDVQMIAGVATAGIAHAALVADEMNLGMLYVREKAKEHGLQNQIEGFYNEGDKVVVLDDLFSTGGSTIKAVNALREAGVNVLSAWSIFSYDFMNIRNNFTAANTRHFSLCSFAILIERARDLGQIDNSEMHSLIKWFKNPSEWLGFSAANTQ